MLYLCLLYFRPTEAYFNGSSLLAKKSCQIGSNDTIWWVWKKCSGEIAEPKSHTQIEKTKSKGKNYRFLMSEKKNAALQLQNSLFFHRCSMTHRNKIIKAVQWKFNKYIFRHYNCLIKWLFLGACTAHTHGSRHPHSSIRLFCDDLSI